MSSQETLRDMFWLLVKLAVIFWAYIVVISIIKSV
jgi:hypothetical protein